MACSVCQASNWRDDLRDIYCPTLHRAAPLARRTDRVTGYTLNTLDMSARMHLHDVARGHA
jgi:hypothetical protein